MTNVHRQAVPKFREWRHILASAWARHFAASIAIIWFGSIHYDDDRKYIPIDAGKLGDQCPKAYANVLVSSMSDNGAIICCTQEITDGICRSVPGYLIFAQRLTRLPEAWLLPLFPLMLRGVVDFSRRRQLNESNSTTWKRRLFLYIFLIQIRGWILYLLFDKIENLLVQPAEDECWYDDLLRSHQTPCEGKVTDYSDHVVLFFAQILPIPLTEVLFSFEVPYWKNRTFLVPSILGTGMLYLYLISFLATYKTAAYFHTMHEIGVGYVVSLLIQIPLFLITSTSFMEPIRNYFFGRDT